MSVYSDPDYPYRIYVHDIDDLPQGYTAWTDVLLVMGHDWVAPEHLKKVELKKSKLH